MLHPEILSLLHPIFMIQQLPWHVFASISISISPTCCGTSTTSTCAKRQRTSCLMTGISTPTRAPSVATKTAATSSHFPVPKNRSCFCLIYLGGKWGGEKRAEGKRAVQVFYSFSGQGFFTLSSLSFIPIQSEFPICSSL